MRRWTALFLSVLLLCQLSFAPVYAAERVYFTAVGNNVLPLSDGTMPFWSGGYIYVAASVFTGTGRESLGISQVVNNEKNRVVLYSGGRSLTFDLNQGSARDNDGQAYNPGAVRRNGAIFVPAYAVSRCFELTYSVIEVRRGSLIWIRQPSYTLSDSYYADAAEYSMESVYADYLRAREQTEEPPERPAPSTGSAGGGTSGSAGTSGGSSRPAPPEPAPAVPEPEPAEEEPRLDGRRVYLCIAAGGDTAGLLDALDAYQAQGTFFFSPEQMEASGNLLRRMSGTGQSVGILADGGGAKPVALQLEEGNAVLSKATCGKTRLAMVLGSGQSVPEGFRAVRPNRDGTAAPLQSRNAAERLLQRIAQGRGDVILWLGDGVSAAGLRAFLYAVREAGGLCPALTELS